MDNPKFKDLKEYIVQKRSIGQPIADTDDDIDNYILFKKAIRQPNWSKEETDLLMSCGDKTFPEICALFPHRTPTSIRVKIDRVKLSFKRKYSSGMQWKPEDDQFLRDNCGTMSTQQIAKSLNKTIMAVARRRNKLGVKVLIRNIDEDGKVERFWSDEEKNKLLCLLDYAPYAKVAKTLNRTVCAIIRMAKVMGIKRNQGRYNVREVAKLLRVSIDTVCRYRDKLNQNWSKKTTEYKSINLRADEEDIMAIANAILKSNNNFTVSAKHLKSIADGMWDIEGDIKYAK